MDNSNLREVSCVTIENPFAEPPRRQMTSLIELHSQYRARWNLTVSVTYETTVSRLTVVAKMGIPTQRLHPWSLPGVIITDPPRDRDVVDVMMRVFLDPSNFVPTNGGLFNPPPDAIRRLIVDTWHITVPPYNVSRYAFNCDVISHKWETILRDIYGTTSSEVMFYLSGLCMKKPDNTCDSPLFTSFAGLPCSEIVNAITSCSASSEKMQYLICHSAVSECIFQHATLDELMSVFSYALNSLGRRFKWPSLTFALRQKRVRALLDASEYEIEQFFELYRRMSGTI